MFGWLVLKKEDFSRSDEEYGRVMELQWAVTQNNGNDWVVEMEQFNFVDSKIAQNEELCIITHRQLAFPKLIFWTILLQINNKNYHTYFKPHYPTFQMITDRCALWESKVFKKQELIPII